MVGPAVEKQGFADLFDGESLRGWHAVPRQFSGLGPGRPMPDEEHDRAHRTAAAASPATWEVVDGALVGRQEPPGSGYGGYLLTDDVFGDFELELEARPDWPADTGIYLRASDSGAQAYQVLLDHRRSGGIGGFYGNGIGGFHALAFAVDVERDAAGRPVGLRVEDPATSVEPVTDQKRSLLSHAASAEEFLAAWRWGDWNQFRVRCTGRHPLIQVWINDLFVAELDTPTLLASVYDPAGVEGLLGPAGRIGLEVHDNDQYVPSGIDPALVPRLGPERWGPAATCRWRHIRIRPLDGAADDE
ncbi:3-keto-disaccharide hydrolase [Trujillonella humicola]|uniref:3-keto-disaccharide hydrolase n=1 Tax=Trujillonella humicola TaxID=3383699 RepID=UPI0039066067